MFFSSNVCDHYHEDVYDVYVKIVEMILVVYTLYPAFFPPADLGSTSAGLV